MSPIFFIYGVKNIITEKPFQPKIVQILPWSTSKTYLVVPQPASIWKRRKLVLLKKNILDVSALMERFQMELAVISQKIVLASSGDRHMLPEKPYPVIAIPGKNVERLLMLKKFVICSFWPQISNILVDCSMKLMWCSFKNVFNLIFER